MRIVSGIDFGTSNSSISYFSDDKNFQFVKVEDDNATMPTALFFEDMSNTVLYGTPAVQAYMQGDYGRFMRGIKRLLGSSIMNSGTQVNGRYMRFSSIVELFVRRLKQMLESEAGQSVDSVVMGRPVHFRDSSEAEDKNAEQQLRDITQKAGFKNIEFQFEPIAAAFAHERRIDHEALACVVDIGGGTSDFTIIKVGKNLQAKIDRSSDILANTGVRVGGNDFDKALGTHGVMPALGRGTTYGDRNRPVPSYLYAELSEWSEINFAYTPRNINMVKSILTEAHDREKYARLLALMVDERAHELLQIVETTKIDLTTLDRSTKTLDCVKDKPSVSVCVEDFNRYIANSIEKIKESIAECLAQAQISPDAVELIILTGGSTEIPLVRKIAGEMLPRAGFSEGNKLSSVGEGLAYDSYRRFIAA